MSAERPCLANGRPWLVRPAAEFLERTLTNAMRVFEYGCGGSTVYFARHCSEVVVVEHHAVWRDEVARYLERHSLANASVNLSPAERTEDRRDPSDPDAYASGRRFCRRLDFRAYASYIDRYPEEYFDLVLVDGRSRPACLKHAVPRIRKGGWLLLDDSERRRYRRAGESIGKLGWERMDFSGWRPHRLYWSRTTAWRKPR